jgi:hypothetical protein
MPSAQQQYDSARENAVSGGEGLRFPLDLGPTAMVLSFQQYGYSDTFGRASKIAKGPIVLPIPEQIVDQYGLNIGERDLGTEGALAMDVAGGIDVGAALSGLAGEAERLGNAMGSGGVSGLMAAGADATQKAKYFTRSVIDGLAPGVGMAIDVVNGSTVNPHKSLAFDGVNLKEFTFNWKLAPKNAAESQALVNIRNKIRASILPDVEGLGEGSTGSLSRAFLTYPDLVHIYFTGLVEQDYIWFKPAMVKNFNVNFSPQGNVILQGGKPGFVEMSMTIQEAQIHTRGDYMVPTTAGGNASEGATAVSETAADTQTFTTEADDTASRTTSAPPAIRTGGGTQ